MISPHPSTAQQVAEQARHERLTRLAARRRYRAAQAGTGERAMTRSLAGITGHRQLADRESRA